MKKIKSTTSALPLAFIGKNTAIRIIMASIFFLYMLSSGLLAQAPSAIITAENAKPGTTDWILTKVIRHENEPYDQGWHRRKEIEGFVSHTSIKAGEILKVYVSTEPADKYKLDIFRMGYYGGKGGRLVKSFNSLKGTMQPITHNYQYLIN